MVQKERDNRLSVLFSMLTEESSAYMGLSLYASFLPSHCGDVPQLKLAALTGVFDTARLDTNQRLNSGKSLSTHAVIDGISKEVVNRDTLGVNIILDLRSSYKYSLNMS